MKIKRLKKAGIILLLIICLFFNMVKANTEDEEDININEITFPDGEATDAKWVTIEQFMQMYKNKEIIKERLKGCYVGDVNEVFE